MSEKVDEVRFRFRPRAPGETPAVESLGTEPALVVRGLTPDEAREVRAYLSAGFPRVRVEDYPVASRDGFEKDPKVEGPEVYDLVVDPSEKTVRCPKCPTGIVERRTDGFGGVALVACSACGTWFEASNAIERDVPPGKVAGRLTVTKGRS